MTNLEYVMVDVWTYYKLHVVQHTNSLIFLINIYGMNDINGINGINLLNFFNFQALEKCLNYNIYMYNIICYIQLLLAFRKKNYAKQIL